MINKLAFATINKFTIFAFLLGNRILIKQLFQCTQL